MEQKPMTLAEQTLLRLPMYHGNKTHRCQNHGYFRNSTGVCARCGRLAPVATIQSLPPEGA